MGSSGFILTKTTMYNRRRYVHRLQSRIASIKLQCFRRFRVYERVRYHTSCSSTSIILLLTYRSCCLERADRDGKDRLRLPRTKLALHCLSSRFLPLLHSAQLASCTGLLPSPQNTQHTPSNLAQSITFSLYKVLSRERG